MKHIKSLLYAMALGLATLFFCVVLSDGLLHMNTNLAGKIVFWVSVIVLPVCARKFTKWRYTIINLPLLYALYFPFSPFYRGGFFSAGGGFISFPKEVYALATALILWCLESLVYAVCNLILHIKRPVSKSE